MCGFTTSAAGRGSGPGESVKWIYWCLPAAGLVTCHECHNTAAAAVTLRVTRRDGTITQPRSSAHLQQLSESSSSAGNKEAFLSPKTNFH